MSPAAATCATRFPREVHISKETAASLYSGQYASHKGAVVVGVSAALYLALTEPWEFLT